MKLTTFGSNEEEGVEHLRKLIPAYFEEGDPFAIPSSGNFFFVVKKNHLDCSMDKNFICEKEDIDGNTFVFKLPYLNDYS